MSLGNSHQVLKELIASILEERGFSVKMEKRIYVPKDVAPPNYADSKYKQSWFSVDVYGEREDEIIMYEIGHCERNKLDWLRKHVGKVIHMPFLTQYTPGFYHIPRKNYVLTEEENSLATPNITNRKW